MATNANANMSANSNSGFRTDPVTGQITHGLVGDRWVDINTYNQIAGGNKGAASGSNPFTSSVVNPSTVTDFSAVTPVSTAVPNAGTFNASSPEIMNSASVSSSPVDDFAIQGDIQDNSQIADFQRLNMDANGNMPAGSQERFAQGNTALMEGITGRAANPNAAIENSLFGEGTSINAPSESLLADGTLDPNNLGDKLPGGGTGTEPTFLQKMFGDKDNKGFFEPVVGGALGAAKVALGYKQFKQAGEALDFQKDAFNRNFNLQTEMINRRLGDRERARQLLQGNTKGAEQASKAYVEKYGVKNN